MTFLEEVAAEVVRARLKHGPMNSLHEAYAVILEELDEFWEEVRAQQFDATNAHKELVQIAAMCQRAVEDRGL